MFPKPVPLLTPNTYAYESSPMVKATGFREYDARWLFEQEINLMGVQALGLGLGTLIREMGVRPELVTGHDFRSYSASIKNALIVGLMAAGIKVHDIGLALSPMAYFAQFALDVPAVAMVTASHNDNGWTGVKMGVQRPVTFGPDEMGRLRDIVLAGAGQYRDGGGYLFVNDFPQRYLADLTTRPKLKRRKLKVVAACGNGTAGAFAPGMLEALGCEVVPLDTELDFTFPRYNPNPEDMHMLHAMADAVKASGADVGLGFDGDGDRCGVVDNHGAEIFADKIGVMLARDLSKLHPDATFVVDVKSTGLFATDPVLLAQGVKADYWKTGHSHIKRRVTDLKALAGFEKSGHFFFNAPVGRGYDDGLVTAIAVLDMLGPQPDQEHGRPLRRPAQDLGLANHVAALRRRAEIRRGRNRHRAHPSDAGGGRDDRRPGDPRRRHRQRRAGDGGGRHLGAGARLLQQAGTRRGGGKPRFGGAPARDVQGGRRHPAREPVGRRLQPDDLDALLLGRQAAVSRPRPVRRPQQEGGEAGQAEGRHDGHGRERGAAIVAGRHQEAGQRAEGELGRDDRRARRAGDVQHRLDRQLEGVGVGDGAAHHAQEQERQEQVDAGDPGPGDGEQCARVGGHQEQPDAEQHRRRQTQRVEAGVHEVADEQARGVQREGQAVEPGVSLKAPIITSGEPLT